MVDALSNAIDVLRGLPEDRQELIARLIMDEVESENKWDELFLKSPEKLGRLAEADGAHLMAQGSQFEGQIFGASVRPGRARSPTW